jgi:N-acetylglutamate synthase-like GNAT family acetyltransferase
MSSDVDYHIQPILPEQRPQLTQFYKRNEYKGKVKATDRSWIMTDINGQIVGAARLCQQAGFTLLRGVWIDKTLRTQGRGSQLLRYLNAAGVLTDIYCFPYLHLESFYRRQGFARVSQVPASLQPVLARYNRYDEQVLLMTLAS